MALQPATGGIFTIDLLFAIKESNGSADPKEDQISTIRLWDRKEEGGFPGRLKPLLLGQIREKNSDEASD